MGILKSHVVFRNTALLDAEYKKLGFIRCIVTSCRAVVLPRFGGPDVLELRSNVEVPDLKPNEVLVRACAVSTNPLDTREEELKGAVVLIFLHKQNLPGALDDAAVTEALELHEIKNRQRVIFKTSAIKGEGLFGLDWFSNTLKLGGG